MDRIIIEGGNPIKGHVEVSGAKNAALPILAACLLTGGAHRLERIPALRDIRTIRAIMSEMGVEFREEGGALWVNSENIDQFEASYDLVRTMRASILLLGPLLARMGRARISLPGGCAIGARPVNLHLKALAAMGVEISLEGGYINGQVDGLKGATVFFDIPTVTGTENVMMAAARAQGRSVLRNAAMEPEVVDLANMLRGMGADIVGDGTDTIVIHGVDDLRPTQHTVIDDRIEAGTFMIAAAMT
jgi:UDP-N-acetylglucosamine 1-carboxyvinyltransferase